MSNRKKINLLVTGAAGFIGSNFVHYWLDEYKDSKVVVLDALTYAGNLDNLNDLQSNSYFKFVKGNICDTDLIKKRVCEPNSVNYI